MDLDIAVKTANFIVKLTMNFKVDVMVINLRNLRSRTVSQAGNGYITGGPSMSRRWWSTRRIGAAFAFVASAPGTREACLRHSRGPVTRDTENYSMC